MSPNCKVQLADARWLAWLWRGWTFWLGSAMFQSEPIRRSGPTCRDCGIELELDGVTDGDGRWLYRQASQSRGPPIRVSTTGQLFAEQTQ